MKDFISHIKDYAFIPLTSTIGTVTLVGFCMTLLPALSFLPKTFVMFIVLPWVLGH